MYLTKNHAKNFDKIYLHAIIGLKAVREPMLSTQLLHEVHKEGILRGPRFPSRYILSKLLIGVLKWNTIYVEVLYNGIRFSQK